MQWPRLDPCSGVIEILLWGHLSGSGISQRKKNENSNACTWVLLHSGKVKTALNGKSILIYYFSCCQLTSARHALYYRLKAEKKKLKKQCRATESRKEIKTSSPGFSEMCNTRGLARDGCALCSITSASSRSSVKWARATVAVLSTYSLIKCLT